MKAVRVVDGTAQTVDVAPPAGDGVIIDVRAAGICGSDLHLVELGVVPPGVTLGHEFAGIAPDGRPVAIEPVSGCGSCAHCGVGDQQLCADVFPNVLGIGRDGGMAEQVLVRPESLVPLAGPVDVGDACLVEPLAVAVHGFRLAGLRPDQRVAVVGGGTIGQCAVAIALHVGSEVTLVARHEAQRVAGERLGAVEKSDEPYDVVVDCAGSGSGLELAANLARGGGTILVLASYWSGVEFPAAQICLKEVRIVPSSMYGMSATGRDVDAAAAVLAATPDLAPAIITHRFPLDAATEAFAVAADRSAGSIKVAFDARL